MAKGPKRKQEELSAEERELFLSAFYQKEGSAKKFTKKEEDVGKPAPAPQATSEYDVSDHDRALFLAAVEKDPANFFVEPKREPRKYTRALSPKKKNMVDAKIDLHGYSVENAVFALQRFLDKEVARGSKILLVVHGKGTGVLRSAVWSVLTTSALVDDLRVASAKLGGQGAIVVRINRRLRR